MKPIPLLKKAWSLYESETYDWDEMVSFLGGSKPDMDVKNLLRYNH